MKRLLFVGNCAGFCSNVGITNRKNLELTAVHDLDLSTGLTGPAAVGLDLLHDIHAIDNLTEHAVMAVQMRSGHLQIRSKKGSNGGDEELRTVGVGTSVGHGKETGSVVADTEVLVRKLSAVDGLTSVTIEILHGKRILPRLR